ncbi:MAG: NAD-dependent epimerase/dehydratase family protein [Bacteroidia bacterium]|nr:NAD-dependent epimerase/dehydratase family protein [Bacteroidia bacterium]MCX7652287.1 NAD-dependent epimerase/dehydratase family protein [Bacteroidia bacterium]MDW8416549.1 NAD-dependent epimerase/dehydratase family protein [Bacteroidia bacterium]
MWFVTGATGFVGYSFLKEWERREYPVPLRLLVRNPKHPVLKPYLGKVELVHGTLTDTEVLIEYCRGANAIIHAAATISFSPRSRTWMHKTNVEGTRNLVNAAIEAGVQRFVYLSSIAALGRPASPDGLITEDTLWQDSPYNTFYGYTKYLGEKEVWRGGEEGLSVIVFNPGIILGPYIDWRKGSPAFFRMVSQGLLAYPVGTNGFVGVQDVVQAIFLSLDKHPHGWGERYILVAENWKYQKIFAEIAHAVKKAPPRFPIPKELAVGVGWMMEKVGRWFGLPAAVTRETARTSSSDFLYDGSKITRTYPEFQYTPIKSVIQETAKMFLQHARTAQR